MKISANRYLIIGIIVVVLIILVLLIRKTLNDPDEEDPIFKISLIVTITLSLLIVGYVYFDYHKRSANFGSSIESREEHGLFKKKQKAPEPTKRMTSYGNPMKKETFLDPRRARN